MGKNTLTKVGSWSFIIGVILALAGGLISGLLGPNGGSVVAAILVLLGLIVGFLNVTGKEAMPFLLAAVSLVIVATQGSILLSILPIVGDYFKSVFSAMTAFIIAATVVVALKAIYGLAKDE